MDSGVSCQGNPGAVPGLTTGGEGGGDALVVCVCVGVLNKSSFGAGWVPIPAIYRWETGILRMGSTCLKIIQQVTGGAESGPRQPFSCQGNYLSTTF